MSERYETFLQQLRQDLAAPLPGRVAQYRMAPQPRPGGEYRDEPGPGARRGVLVLFYPWQNRVHLPLILRPNYSGVHSGQMGFPGGGHEEIDPDLTATALREAYEEVGVRPDDVTVLGWMSELFVSASNYRVQPVVGWTDYRPRFHLDPYEVAALVEAPLTDFLDPKNHQEEVWRLRNHDVTVPFFNIQDQIIWGATAMMLSEVLDLPAVKRLARMGDAT
jgi:8-oxo-dGTP pyrophosphatase MutT (NUDIX family)